MKIRLPKLYPWMHRVETWWRRSTGAAEMPAAELPAPVPAPVAEGERRLERVVLSEGVAAALFADYAEHRRSPRGHEEIGWILLGVRRGDEAVALAALPAGAERDAGEAHIRFNADAQAIASRILRQSDKRLQLVGIVHTHPGKLTHPSNGDFNGDRAWVANLRHGDAVFGIGTADDSSDLQFTWYTLAAGDAAYRPLPAHVEPGPDLAAALKPIWPALEAHASALEKLCRLFARVQFERVEDGLAVRISLVEPHRGLRLLLKGNEVRYYLERGGELIAVDPHEPHLERAVFLILAELAKDQPSDVRGHPALTP